MDIMHNPLHPGEIIKETLCDGAGLNVTEAAIKLKVDRTTLSRLLNGRAGISADMADRLSLLLGTSAEMWLNLQRDYDLFCVRNKKKRPKIKPLSEQLAAVAA
jgi:addiction module HigA family antidote